jgi:hypothetical protein
MRGRFSRPQFSGADGGYARDITEDYEEYDYFDENGDIYSPDAYDEEVWAVTGVIHTPSLLLPPLYPFLFFESIAKAL